MEKINWKKNKEDSYYAYINTSQYDEELKNILISKAYESKAKKSRYCFHDDSAKETHVMLICHTKQAIVLEHEHLDKDEYFILVEGECKVIINEKKEVYLNKKNPLIKVKKNISHKLEIISNYILFYEIK